MFEADGNEKHKQAREPTNGDQAPVPREIAGAVGAKRDVYGEHQPQRASGGVAR